uniref:RING-type domain-containing protein n=1 Tax=Aegilops tauschii subsp. strangulata TaxID=200361 RepID=A0A453PVS9_AEGTS
FPRKTSIVLSNHCLFTSSTSSDAGHSEPSCSTPAYQKVFRPVTRSMTRIPPAVTATPDAKKRVDSTSSNRSTPDARFSIQLAAARPTVTRARTPQEVTKSAWKPLTQPAVLSEDLKRASTPATNPTAKRSRVTNSQAAKDSASKVNRNVRSGKKNRNEECASQADQSDGAVIASPPKKLHSGKGSSNLVSKRKSTIRSKGAKLAAQLLMGNPETELGKDPASVDPLPAQQLQLEIAKKSNAITEAIASGTSQVNQSVAAVITEAISSGTSQVNQLVAPAVTDAVVRGKRQADQLVTPVITEAIGNRRTRQISQPVAPVITEAIGNRTTQVNQFVAPVVTLPRQQLQNNIQQKLSKITLPTSQASVPAGATGPMVVPKLEIGNANESSHAVSSAAYRRALLIKQQEQLLQQYKLVNSQAQLHIKGPALFEDDEAPETEPLGTRCALCKLDLAFEAHGGAAHDASAPPVIAVLRCHHTFHSSCIEDVYGLAEPAQCIACLDCETAH